MSIQSYAKLAVFMGGVVGLGVELGAERLLAPAFGTTLDLWSIIIGLTFTALSAGYEIGGRLIDRLERRDFVHRVSETGDRRRIHLELTEAGKQAGASVRAELVKLFSCSLNELTDAELETLGEGLTILDRVIANLEARGFQHKNEH